MSTHVRLLEPNRDRRPGTLIPTALYVELDDRIVPVRGFTRHGPGGLLEATDAELTCIA